jgi:preprotein translocase subunit SecE
MADAGSKAQVTKDAAGGPKGFLGSLSRLPGFVRETRIEARKISWPTRRETLTTAMMVGIMAFIMSLFLFGIDQVFGLVVRSLIDLAK